MTSGFTKISSTEYKKHELKISINWTSPKLKTYALQKTLLIKMKWQATDYKRKHSQHIPQRTCTRIYTELPKLTKKKIDNNDWAKALQTLLRRYTNGPRT